MGEMEPTYVPEEKIECPNCGKIIGRLPPLSLQLAHDKAKSQIATLRAALIGLVGFSTKEELEQVEFTLRAASLPMPMRDKAVAIDAIHALLATMEGV